eukprot:TRINITY_DN29986_c0_g1_i2.p1 TRINITY_DN29986_c0_g1~~TRINITY_DN29986_c0_g1_i2.p1  ORF type:complete len:392 (+),score=74.44 TRINITY_DN29986_c0_g1_i2:104-1279(+)
MLAAGFAAAASALAAAVPQPATGGQQPQHADTDGLMSCQGSEERPPPARDSAVAESVAAVAKCGEAQWSWSPRPRRAAPAAGGVGRLLPLRCAGCAAYFPGSWGWREPLTAHGFNDTFMKWYLPLQFPVGEWATRRHARRDGVIAAIERATRRLGTSRLVVDLGANIGQSLLWMLALFGGTARVLSYEPNPVLVDKFLRPSLARWREQGRGNAALFQMGIGNLSGVRPFWRNGDSEMGSFHRLPTDCSPSPGGPTRCGESVDVQVRRLDDHLAELGLHNHPIALLKVDSQRWEYEALVGAPRALRNTAAVTVEPGHSRIVPLLAESGFRVYALGCHSIARIAGDRPWWWGTNALAVRPWLLPEVDQYACWDFRGTRWRCAEAGLCAADPHV